MLDRNDTDVASLTLSPAAATGNRRESPRVRVLRVAKLSTPDSEELCLVRNISAGGLMADVYSDLPVGARVTAEFKSGETIGGKILWRRDDRIGVRFDTTPDAAGILSDEARAALPRRTPRVGLEVTGRVRFGSRYRTVTLDDMSQGGARYQPAYPEDEGAKLILMVAGLPAIPGSVRRLDGDRGGIAFDVALPFDVLAQWVAQVGRAGSSGPA